MRYLALSLVVAALVVATACAGKSSSNSSDQSSNSDQTATTAPMSASTEAATEAPSDATTAAPADTVPHYPGAASEASGSSDSMGKTESGTVLSTDDSFDKVYAWYQQHLPAGSEKVHTTSPEGAVFTVGDSTSGLQSVSISTSQGRTVITIGAVKMQ
ncbi:MAG TPA: hypothetical protein VHT92_02595 [Candidatus Cybelea sp.]|jgi:hypothetical protein|nr:hypothetical protein [Candidatus Cybelea sp.]